MQKKISMLLIILFFLGLMAITNPTKAEYVSWAQEKTMAQSDGFLEKALTALFGSKAFESTTQTSNFVFFSFYSTELSKHEKFTVIGLFHNFIPLNLSPEEDVVQTTVALNKHTQPVSSSTSSKSESKGETTPPKAPATASSTVKVIGNEGIFELPLVGVETSYGYGHDRKPSLLPKQPLSDLEVNLPTSRLSQMAVYWMNDGDDIHGYTYFGPIGWTVKTAAIGANGSTSLELISGDQSITYFHAGGCYGCTVDYIGEYFPNLRDWAEKNAVAGAIPTHPDWNIVPIDNNTVSYSFQNTVGQEVNGVAIARNTEEGQPFFWRAEVTTNDHDLATTVLNSYLSVR